MAIQFRSFVMWMHVRLTAAAILTFTAMLFALGCGGKQTMASKSAAAYRDAIAKGVPVASGGHGGHTNPEAGTSGGSGHDQTAGMNHSQMPSGSSGMSDMPAMQKGSMAGMSGMNHSQMKSGSMEGMARIPGMQQGSMPGMSGMDHSQMKSGSMEGMANMAGMQQGSMAGMNMAAMRHGATSPVVLSPAPTNSSGLAELNPSATLKPDAFDQPAPISVREANKAAGGGAMQMEDMSGSSQSPATAPQSKPAVHQHSGGNGERQ